MSAIVTGSDFKTGLINGLKLPLSSPLRHELSEVVSSIGHVGLLHAADATRFLRSAVGKGLIGALTREINLSARFTERASKHNLLLKQLKRRIQGALSLYFDEWLAANALRARKANHQTEKKIHDLTEALQHPPSAALAKKAFTNALATLNDNYTALDAAEKAFDRLEQKRTHSRLLTQKLGACLTALDALNNDLKTIGLPAMKAVSDTFTAPRRFGLDDDEPSIAIDVFADDFAAAALGFAPVSKEDTPSFSVLLDGPIAAVNKTPTAGEATPLPGTAQATISQLIAIEQRIEREMATAIANLSTLNQPPTTTTQNYEHKANQRTKAALHQQLAALSAERKTLKQLRRLIDKSSLAYDRHGSLVEKFDAAFSHGVFIGPAMPLGKELIEIDGALHVVDSGVTKAFLQTNLTARHKARREAKDMGFALATYHALDQLRRLSLSKLHALEAAAAEQARQVATLTRTATASENACRDAQNQYLDLTPHQAPGSAHTTEEKASQPRLTPRMPVNAHTVRQRYLALIKAMEQGHIKTPADMQALRAELRLPIKTGEMRDIEVLGIELKGHIRETFEQFSSQMPEISNALAKKGHTLSKEPMEAQSPQPSAPSPFSTRPTPPGAKVAPVA